MQVDLQGLDYDREYIDLANKPDWIFEKTEKGTVPILKDGEKWVPDSGDIMTYLGTQYPEPDIGPAGMPDEIGSEFFPAFVQLFKESASKEKAKKFLAQLQELDDFLGKSGQAFFNGAEMGGADCLIVSYFSCHDEP
jgi:glutathione S-transferase